MIRERLRRILPAASIRRKLVLGVAFVHLVLMTIFIVDLVQRQRDFLWDELTRRTLHHAHVLAVSSSAWLLSDDLAGMEEVVEGSARGSGVRDAMIVDTKGRVLAHTDRALIGRYLSDAISLAALSGAREPRVYQQSEDTINAIAPILIADRLIGWSILAVDKSATAAHLSYVTKTGVLYTIAAIAIGTVFAMLLSHSILRQLRLLLGGVDNLRRNVLNQPVKVVSDDEVGKVAEAYNRAITSLAESRKTLTAEIGERKRAEDALRTFSRRQVDAIEDERKRIARDLHDELGQMLSGMQFCLRSLPLAAGTDEANGAPGSAYTKLSSEVERMGVSIHRIANGLRPTTLDHLGLLPTIEAFVSDQLALVGDRLSISIDAAGFHRRLPVDVEMIAYRIVQEGLTNVVKHAQAKHVDIVLTVAHPSLIVVIRDDGVGISKASAAENGQATHQGIGLLGLRERAASIGGKLEVRSRRGGGTQLRAELPYAGDGNHGEDQNSDRR